MESDNPNNRLENFAFLLPVMTGFFYLSNYLAAYLYYSIREVDFLRYATFSSPYDFAFENPAFLVLQTLTFIVVLLVISAKNHWVNRLNRATFTSYMTTILLMGLLLLAMFESIFFTESVEYRDDPVDIVVDNRVYRCLYSIGKVGSNNAYLINENGKKNKSLLLRSDTILSVYRSDIPKKPIPPPMPGKFGPEYKRSLKNWVLEKQKSC